MDKKITRSKSVKYIQKKMYLCHFTIDSILGKFMI